MSRLAPFYEALDRLGAVSMWRRIYPGRLILCYHNVIPRQNEAKGDASLHLPRDQFERQLDWVVRNYRVVPLASMLETGASSTRESYPIASITFDDAYSGVLRNAIPALRERRIPATIFVTTGATETPLNFWWDLVASQAPSLDRLSLRNRYGGRGTEILKAVGIDAMESHLPQDYLPADWRALKAVVDADISFGAHTRSHPMLTLQSQEELATEFGGVLELLEEKVGSVVPVIAYPYGDVNDKVARLAAEAGYQAGVTTAPSLYREQHRMQLPRLNVPSGMAPAAFRVEASGMRFRRAPR